MRKVLITILLFSFSICSYSQAIIYENDFNGYPNYSHFPYDGWVEEGVPNALWQFTGSTGNLAGGDDSELLHYGSASNPFNGMTRAVSPEIDLTGYSEVKFNFLYGGEDWSPGFEIGVATRSGGGDWNVVWSLVNQESINGPTGSTEINVIVDNADIGQPDVQYCFYLDGVNSDCKSLCFDNFVISQILDNDIYTSGIEHSVQKISGEEMIVQGTYYNNGLSNESFNAILNIYDLNGGLLFNDTESISDLVSSSETTISFQPYVVEENDQLFTIEILHDLPNDGNPSNDILSGTFNSYSFPRQMVLLEIGTATWCQFCPGVSIAADEFIEFGKDVAVVEYHSSDNFATGDVQTRFGVDFYNSYSFPTSVFDGIEIYYGGSATNSVYDQMLPLYEQKKEINSGLQLSMDITEVTPLNYSVDINIDKFAPLLPHDYAVYLILTESHIDYSWGQGLLDEVNFVERFMLPNEYGRSINLQNNSNLTENFSVIFGDTIVTENCELVAFVQDMNTLEIMQATKKDLLTTVEIAGKKQNDNFFKIYPNPSNNGIFTLNINSQKNDQHEIIIMDNQGKIVRTYNNIRSLKTEIDLSGETPGMYFILVLSENHVYNSEKIIIK